MTQPKLEICQLRHVSQDKQSLVDSLFASSRIHHYWIAEMATDTDNVVLAKSKTEEWYTNLGLEHFNQQISLLHQQILQQLLSDGWEPFGTDRYGRVTALRRDKGQTTTPNKTDTVELLKQLDSLREAGILTQKEFDEKKAEILKRL